MYLIIFHVIYSKAVMETTHSFPYIAKKINKVLEITN